MTPGELPLYPLTSRQAGEFGWTPRRLRDAVSNRQVTRLMTGVYCRTEVDVTVDVRLAALRLVVGTDFVACDRTAAWIWGVDCFAYRELDVLPAVETFVLPGGRPSERQGVAGGSRDLHPADWVDIDGVKVTTPLRTALDLGCKLDRRYALAAMDALQRGHGFTPEDLSRALPSYFRRRGVIQLRQLVPIVDGRAESPRESWARLEIIDAGLPCPRPQFWIVIDGVPTYRLDLAYPHARIAVEYDGAEFHTSKESREADEERRGWLERNGWRVTVLTANDFAPGAVEVWIETLRNDLERAQRLPKRWFERRHDGWKVQTR